MTSDFENPGLAKAFAVFFIGQPLWYYFIYVLYMASAGEAASGSERCCYVMTAFIYYFT